MIIVLPAPARPLLESHLPADAEVRWFASAEDAYAMAPGAEVGWLDMQVPANTGRALLLGTELKLVTTIYAGTDAFPLTEMSARGTRLIARTAMVCLAVLLALSVVAYTLPGSDLVRAVGGGA